MEARGVGGSPGSPWVPMPGVPLEEQAELFGVIAMSSLDGVLVCDLDGSVVWANPAAADMFGCTLDDLLGRPLTSLLPEHAQTLTGERLLDVERRGTFTATGLRRREPFDLAVTLRVRRAQDGRPLGAGLVLREVTPEVDAQRALRESEARYRAIVETAQEGILAVSPAGDVLFANSRLTEILGLSMDEVYALSRRGLFAPERAAETARRLAARPREAGPERSDLPYRHPDGGDRMLHVSASALTAAEGSVLGSLAMVSDVTEQRAAEENLRRQALHDPLTGLPNRLLFVDRLQTAAARQERAEDSVLAVLFLDLDHFKRVNDTHGHQTGDRVLVEVAARLEQAVRATDTVARLGGDEFAVICEGAHAGSAALVTSRIHQAFKEPVVVGGRPIEVGMSIGAALSPPHGAEDLLRLADMAMYEAKATSGHGGFTYDGGAADEAGQDAADGAAGETSGRADA